MQKVEDQVGTVQNTIREISGKTKPVTKAFKTSLAWSLDGKAPLWTR